jgi:hypothetical protein
MGNLSLLNIESSGGSILRAEDTGPEIIIFTPLVVRTMKAQLRVLLLRICFGIAWEKI